MATAEKAFTFAVTVKSTFTMWLHDQVPTDPKGILCFPYDISNGTKLFSHSLRPYHPIPMTYLETEPFHKVFLPIPNHKKFVAYAQLQLLKIKKCIACKVNF